MRPSSISFDSAVEDVSAGNMRIQRVDYLEAGQFPIVDQGQSLIGGYTNDVDNVVRSKGPWIVFGDHTRALKFLDYPFCMGADGVKVLKPRQASRLDTKFLYHFLKANELPSAGYSRHYKFLRRLEVPLPSLDEQRRIAAILDKADALRRMRKRALDLLDGLTQSIFLEMFGDVTKWNLVCPLGDLSEIVSGITKGRKANGEEVRPIGYMAVANVQDKRLDLSAVKTIEATEAEIRRFRLLRDDLLLTEGGDPDKLGRGTLWKEEIAEVIHQNHIFRVRVRSDEILPLYLMWLVSSTYGKSYFLRYAKQTTGIASINKQQLSSFPVPIPPLKLQSSFAKALEKVQLFSDAAVRAKAASDIFYTSLQSQAFLGQL